jgi:hypothetical protein
MVVGLTITSPKDRAGSSTGKPPARRTPRLTASARSRRCAWQGDRSLQGDVAILGRQVVDNLAIDQDLPAGDVLETGDHAQRCALSAARRTDQRHEFVVRDGKIDAVYHFRFTVVLHQLA